MTYGVVVAMAGVLRDGPVDGRRALAKTYPFNREIGRRPYRFQ